MTSQLLHRADAYLFKALALQKAGRMIEALTVADQCIEIRRMLLPKLHTDTTRALATKAAILQGLGEHQDAISILTEVLDHWTKVRGPESVDVSSCGSSRHSQYTYE